MDGECCQDGKLVRILPDRGAVLNHYGTARKIGSQSAARPRSDPATIRSKGSSTRHATPSVSSVALVVTVPHPPLRPEAEPRGQPTHATHS